MANISAVIIALNESGRIEKTISALSCCNEIIVIDSGSSDDTVEICKNLGAKVFHHDFINFGEQKQFGFSLAANDWVLSIDADEVLSPDLNSEIGSLFQNGTPDCSGFCIPIQLVFLNKVFRFGKESKYKPLRLFDRKQANITSPEIHEKIEVPGVTPKLKNPLLHYSYRNLNHYFEKFNDYTSKAAIKLAAEKKTISYGLLLLKYPFNFLKYYFLHLNFMNGFPGLVWAWLSANYSFIKHLKAREIIKTK